MKKLFIVATLAIGAAAFSQTGKVGVNEPVPQATLDIKPNAANGDSSATTNEGVLIPRLAKARVAGIASANRVEGTLVYVTDDVVAGDNATFTGTGKGFYSYDAAASRWVKIGSGAATASNNIYTADGTLTAARTVTQDNKDLTFNTGTASNITNGNLKTDAFFMKTPVITTASSYTVLATDGIIVSKATASNTLVFPDSAANKGRVFFISNQNTTASNVTISSSSPVLGTATILQLRGKMVVSDGPEWVVISYN